MSNVSALRDQASGVRQRQRTRPVKVVAVSGGKGGVGKTTVSVNLALALARLGQRTLLLDADLGLANADLLCGIDATANLAHVVAGRAELKDVMVEAPGGFTLIPGAVGSSHAFDVTRSAERPSAFCCTSCGGLLGSGHSSAFSAHSRASRKNFVPYLF